jgi:transcription elongation factor Elf1
MIDLGYANSWQGEKELEIIHNCRMKGHERETTKISRNAEEISCKICGYRYKIDSGD